LAPLEESIDHLIYAPVPFKGYAIRARSPDAIDEQFKDATKDWFVPFDEQLFVSYEYEARVVNRPANSSFLFLSRIFRRPKLDDLGREGEVCHIAALPIDLISKGLGIKDVNDALVDFERKNKTLPIGEMPKLQVKWEDSAQEDCDLSMMKSMIPEELARKIVLFLTEDFDAKVFAVLKRNYKERIQIVMAISKFLYRVGLPSFTVTSDCPMDTILNYFSNLVVSDYLPRLKPNSGWKVVNLTPSTIGTSSSMEMKTIDETLKMIYGS
jgi:hypothetical protein